MGHVQRIKPKNKSGALLRAARLEKGLTLKEAAARIGRSAGTLAKWERDGVGPMVSIAPVMDACTLYDLDADALFLMATQEA